MAYNLTEEQKKELVNRIGTSDLSRTQWNIKLSDGTIIPAGINPGQAATIQIGAPNYGVMGHDYLKSQGAVAGVNTDPRKYGGQTNYWTLPSGEVLPAGKDFYENLGKEQARKQGQAIIPTGSLNRSTAEGAAIARSFAGQNVLDPQKAMQEALQATPLAPQGTITAPTAPLLTSGTVQGGYRGRDIYAGTDAQVQAQMRAIDVGGNQLGQTPPNVQGQQDQLASMLQTVRGMAKQVEATPASRITSPVDGSKIAPTPAIPAIPTPTSNTDVYYSGLTKQVADLTTKLETERQNQQTKLDTQNVDLKKQLDDIKILQSEGMLKQGSLVAQEAQEKREQLDLEITRFNENYNKVQGLATQLTDLMTTGNEIIAQQKAVTGLSSIRNPRIAQTISDITAQTGVIQASISVYNGQMNQAQSQLQSARNAITDIYKDQIDYYDTVYNYYRDQKADVSSEKKSVNAALEANAKTKTDVIKKQLANMQKTYDVVSTAMLDPDTALTYAQAGITLNDTVEQINAKLKTQLYTNEIKETSNKMALDGASYLAPGQNPPANSQVFTTTDSMGKTKDWYKPASKTSTDNTSKGYAYADELMKLNPTASYEELYDEILRDDQLTATQASAFLARNGKFKKTANSVDSLFEDLMSGLDENSTTTPVKEKSYIEQLSDWWNS